MRGASGPMWARRARGEGAMCARRPDDDKERSWDAAAALSSRRRMRRSEGSTTGTVPLDATGAMKWRRGAWRAQRDVRRAGAGGRGYSGGRGMALGMARRDARRMRDGARQGVAGTYGHVTGARCD